MQVHAYIMALSTCSLSSFRDVTCLLDSSTSRLVASRLFCSSEIVWDASRSFVANSVSCNNNNVQYSVSCNNNIYTVCPVTTTFIQCVLQQQHLYSVSCNNNIYTVCPATTTFIQCVLQQQHLYSVSCNNNIYTVCPATTTFIQCVLQQQHLYSVSCNNNIYTVCPATTTMFIAIMQWHILDEGKMPDSYVHNTYVCMHFFTTP